MTPISIPHLRELIAKGTQGEWTTAVDRPWLFGPPRMPAYGRVESTDDAALMVAAVNSLGPLLDELEAARETAKRARDVEAQAIAERDAARAALANTEDAHLKFIADHNFGAFQSLRAERDALKAEVERLRAALELHEHLLVHSLARQVKRCDHAGIGLPGCGLCDGRIKERLAGEVAAALAKPEGET